MIARIIKEEISTLGRLSKKNLEWINAIENPTSFKMGASHPGSFRRSATNKNGETALQRDIFHNEQQWLDMELPICTFPICHRIDLIGIDETSHILLELKRKNKPDATSTLSAVLQVIAYYLIIKNNCKVLDAYQVFHIDTDRPKWKWIDAIDDIRLQVRANKEFWTNQRTNTKYERAVKAIIDRLRETVVIELVDEYGEILYSNLTKDSVNKK